jgi:DNA-binding NtrC family response regulator
MNKESFTELKNRLSSTEKALKKIFRFSLRDEVRNRVGMILFLDDRPEQATILEGLLSSARSDIPLMYARNVPDAKELVTKHGEKAVKVCIVDIELQGDDGRSFIEWLQENHFDIPVIISTGHGELKDEIEREFPDSEIFIKGHTKIEELAEALALTTPQSANVIPTDNIPSVSGRAYLSSSFLKRIFSIAF